MSANEVQKSKKDEPKLTPEQAQYKADKWSEYDQRMLDIRETDLGRETSMVHAYRLINEFHGEDLWFAENTQRQFRVEHFSKNLHLASQVIGCVCDLARMGNENAIREVADFALELCECMDSLLTGEGEESDRAAEIMSDSARVLPYWPILQTLHKAGNNHFPRLRDKLQLGKDSWLNVSEAACYSLQTPINRYVWRVLRLFQEAHEMIKYEKRCLDKYGAKRFYLGLDDWLVMNDAEKEIARKSFHLGSPTKGTSADWTDKAIMPFIDEREKDFESVPEFADSVRRAKIPKRYLQRKEIRRDILRAMQSVLSK